MIAFIKGRVEEVDEDSVSIEVGGIGYRVYVSELTKNIVQTFETTKLYTYMSVREDAIILFGFLSKEEFQLFKFLISVTGVGPKAGLSILSTLDCSQLCFAILSGDSKSISKAKGIGNKTAERIILELKDKVSTNSCFLATLNCTPEMSQNIVEKEKQKDVIDALISLGYTGTDAMRSITKINNIEQLTEEEILKIALKNIGTN